MGKKLPVRETPEETVVHPALATGAKPVMRVAGVPDQPRDETGMRSLAEMAQLARELELDVAECKEMLSVREGRLRHLLEVRIPAMMDELGMESYRTSTGATVTVENIVSTTLAKGKDETETQHTTRVARAFAWLRERGHDGIIKTTLAVACGKGEAEKASKVAEALTQIGVDFTRDEGVNPQTLKAFIKEQLRTPGDPLPLDLFRVAEFNRAKVSPPKEK